MLLESYIKIFLESNKKKEENNIDNRSFEEILKSLITPQTSDNEEQQSNNNNNVRNTNQENISDIMHIDKTGFERTISKKKKIN